MPLSPDSHRPQWKHYKRASVGFLVTAFSLIVSVIDWRLMIAAVVLVGAYWWDQASSIARAERQSSEDEAKASERYARDAAKLDELLARVTELQQIAAHNAAEKAPDDPEAKGLTLKVAATHDAVVRLIEGGPFKIVGYPPRVTVKTPEGVIVHDSDAVAESNQRRSAKRKRPRS
jgi:hypothetical protein